MVGRHPSRFTITERELYRLLDHAVRCFDPACEKCLSIEDRLDDGPSSFPDNPDVRVARVSKALDAAIAHATSVSDAIQGAPVGHLARASAFDLLDLLAKCQRLLREPLPIPSPPQRLRIERIPYEDSRV